MINRIEEVKVDQE